MRIQKYPDSLPNSPDACGRKPYPERKICGFKNIRIRVDGASVTRWRPGLKMLRMKEVTALKDAAENLNTRKSTINWVKVSENW